MPLSIVCKMCLNTLLSCSPVTSTPLRKNHYISINSRSTSYPNTLTKSKEEQNFIFGLIPVSLFLRPDVNPILLELILFACSSVSFTYLIISSYLLIAI